MKKIKLKKLLGLIGVMLIFILTSPSLHAQQHDTLCTQFGDVEYQTTIALGYGTGSALRSTFNAMDVIVGQPVIDVVPVGLETTAKFGLFAELDLAPKAPFLIASQGDFPDRVQIEWQVDAFSPSPAEFRIFRDDAFLGKLDSDVREFIDFNVQAGEVYNYSIMAVSGSSLESQLGHEIGFVNPNGVISGQITTRNGNPVPDVTVIAEPTFNQALYFDGVDDHVCVSYDSALPSEQFTFSSWVKIGGDPDGESIVDLGSDIDQNWWLRASESGNPKGVIFGIGGGSASSVSESALSFDTDPDEWHHVAAVYNGIAVTLYLDGEFMGSQAATLDTAKTRFSFGRIRNGGSDYFEGGLDDVRIYNRALSQTELLLNKDITVSSRTEGLVSYWKFDEGQGNKAFDLSDTQLDGFLFGPEFTTDSPALLNAGTTDGEGNYIIEGIDYSQENRFVVSPSKIFYDNYSLEFNASDETFVKLPDFDLPDTATIQVVTLPFDRFSEQSILSYGTGSSAEFDLYVMNDNYFLTLNGESQQIAPISGQFDHLAITLDGATDDVEVFLNGASTGTYSYGSVDGAWTGEKWVVGAEDTLNTTNHFTGLVDEIAIYNSILTQATIQTHGGLGESGGVDSSDPAIIAYYNFNESSGEEAYDFGPSMMADGEINRALYSIVARRQDESPHVFDPNSRRVNLNFTSSSADQINFVDISTVGVSGVVRFEDTFCFQDSVEILVDGESHFPAIFTNSEGRWIADFEPGSNPILQPKFGEDRDSTSHEFFPRTLQIRQLNVPVANVLFQNTTKREVEGQVFGGSNLECRNSIIPVDAAGNLNATVEVKLAAQNGCYEETIVIDNRDGDFVFENVPPIPVTVSVIEHTSNPVALGFFQTQGGSVVDLRLIQKDTVDFQYISFPNVLIDTISSGVLDNECGIHMIYDSQHDSFNEAVSYENHIRVFEQYESFGLDDGVCYLDSFNLIINNQIEESAQNEFVSDSTTYVYNWFANNPNLLPPFQKNMQVTAEVNGSLASASYQVVVLGDKQLPGTISVSGPTEVFGIVYDPPGDGSFATLSEGTKTCTNWEDVNVNTETLGVKAEFKLGSKKTIGLGTSIDVEFDKTRSLEGSFEIETSNSNSAEFCFETTREISTSDGDDIWGTYADVYYGAAINWLIGQRISLNYNFEECSFDSSSVISVEPGGFETEFILSEWQVLTEILPQLEEIVLSDNVPDPEKIVAQNSINKWLTTIAAKRYRQGLDASYAVGSEDPRNITYDAAAGFTETASRELSGTNTFTTTLQVGADFSMETGVEIGGSGFGLEISVGYNHQDVTTEGVTVSNSVETSFTLADDDLNDFYSFDVSAQTPPVLGFSELSSLQNEIDNLEDVIEDGMIQDSFDMQITNEIRDSVDQVLFGGEIPTITTNNYSIFSVPFSDAPMFRLRGGESMCPWIPGTRNREEVFAQVDKNVAINVPTNVPAVFRITLGNIGPNGVDGLVYELGVDEGGNPDGALIKVDGQPLITPIEFQFVGNVSFEKTITVEWPNTGTFDFEDLGLYFASVCQIEHSKSVGYDAGDGGFLIYDDFSQFGDASQFNIDPVNGQLGDEALGGGTGDNFYNRFYQAIELDVFFIEPCSTVDISSPNQLDVITDVTNSLPITVLEYDPADPDLELIRVQYRPIPGDGAWINIEEIPVADLQGTITQIVNWDMAELSDGDYEIRAITQCFDVTLAPGMSEFVLVTKETESPELFGAPEPADGLLAVGDEISITFNEMINCDRIFDGETVFSNINLNNVALINTETGALVPFSHQCVDDKIIITIETEPRFIDGKVLKAVVTGIEDLAGNELAEPIGGPGSATVNFVEWEFLVDLNPLRWEAGSNIREVKQVDEPLALSRNIVNNSGTARNFRITGDQISNLDGSIDYEDIPSWMQVEPRSGTLEPGEILPVTFLFPQDLLVDDYLAEMNVVGDDNAGNAINTDLKVRCAGPEWDFDRVEEFENTMTFTVQLDIFGDVSIDNSDRVAAFINGELRGAANVEFVPAFEGRDNNGDGIIDEADISGAWMAFLTVYGDETDFPPIDFNVFDGSECIVYSDVLEEIDYIPTAQEGIPVDPTVLHVLNVVDRKIPIADGWTWISVNLDLMDNSADNVLESLKYKDGDLIKDDNSFADYTAGSWIGSLSDISYDKRYLFFSEEEDTICLTGVPYDVASSTIDIETGWNWIGFVPQQGLLIDEALASLTPLEGDIVKSQTAFAQYIPTYGWIGNLNVMEPPHGYLLNISNPGVLDYTITTPFKGETLIGKRGPKPVVSSKVLDDPYWTVNTSQFQHNMNITAVIDPLTYDLRDKDQVGVFVDGEIRGYGQAVYVEPLEQFVLFVTVSGNIPNELLEFTLFSERDSIEIALAETMFFKPDEIIGDAMTPFVFTFPVVDVEEVEDTYEFELNIYPNPSNSDFNIELDISKTEVLEMNIYDAVGSRIDGMSRTFHPGKHSLTFKANTLPPGVYQLVLKGETVNEIRRLIKNQ